MEDMGEVQTQSQTTLSVSEIIDQSKNVIKWRHTTDPRQLAYHLSKFLVKVHRKREVEFEKLPANLFKLIDALQRGKVKDDDILYTNDGIVSIKGLKLDERGDIKCDV